jgi:hypothetical protein
MAKWQNDSMLDAALNYIKTNAVRELVIASYTSGDSYATVTATANVLASKTISSTDFTGPADGTLGTAGGRKLTVNAQNSNTIIYTGTATHIALTNGSDTVYYVTTTTSQALVDNDSNTVNIPAWIIEIEDAA